MQKYRVEAKENPGTPVALVGKTNSPHLLEDGAGTGSPRKPLTPLQVKLEKKRGSGKDDCLLPRMKPIDGTGNGLNSEMHLQEEGHRSLKKPDPELSSLQEASKSTSQTDRNDLDLITSEIAPLEYYKQLAERRGLALEETLMENQMLCERIEALEEENRQLEEMLEDAKTLAEMVNALSDAANDSGIVRDTTFNTSID